MSPKTGTETTSRIATSATAKGDRRCARSRRRFATAPRTTLLASASFGRTVRASAAPAQAERRPNIIKASAVRNHPARSNEPLAPVAFSASWVWRTNVKTNRAHRMPSPASVGGVALLVTSAATAAATHAMSRAEIRRARSTSKPIRTSVALVESTVPVATTATATATATAAAAATTTIDGRGRRLGRAGSGAVPVWLIGRTGAQASTRRTVATLMPGCPACATVAPRCPLNSPSAPKR